jgi:hypothetical protein
MVTELLQYLWEPELQNEKLIITTYSLFKLGIRTIHLRAIGHVVHAIVKQVCVYVCVYVRIYVYNM